MTVSTIENIGLSYRPARVHQFLLVAWFTRVSELLLETVVYQNLGSEAVELADVHVFGGLLHLIIHPVLSNSPPQPEIQLTRPKITWSRHRM